MTRTVIYTLGEPDTFQKGTTLEPSKVENLPCVVPIRINYQEDLLGKVRVVQEGNEIVTYDPIPVEVEKLGASLGMGIYTTSAFYGNDAVYHINSFKLVCIGAWIKKSLDN